jgi:rRNA maturation endonuclease Nob1
MGKRQTTNGNGRAAKTRCKGCTRVIRRRAKVCPECGRKVVAE